MYFSAVLTRVLTYQSLVFPISGFANINLSDSCTHLSDDIRIMYPDTYMWNPSYYSPHMSISFTEPWIGGLSYGSFRLMNTKPGLAAGSVSHADDPIICICFHLVSFCRQCHLWRILRSS
jgi:hypothetical protein